MVITGLVIMWGLISAPIQNSHNKLMIIPFFANDEKFDRLLIISFDLLI